jgi:hypothetical protein
LQIVLGGPYSSSMYPSTSAALCRSFFCKGQTCEEQCRILTGCPIMINCCER